jgi:integrase
MQRVADVPAQRITKTDIDALIHDLAEAGTTTATGRRRKPWSPASVNKCLQAITGLFADAVCQGLLARSLAELVEPLPTSTRTL